MAAPEEVNADMLAFWNGKGGHTWVARQAHTDITLTRDVVDRQRAGLNARSSKLLFAAHDCGNGTSRPLRDAPAMPAFGR